MSQLDSAGEDLSRPEPIAPPAREGLPPAYRMRADAHYVDLLTSRQAGGREQIAARVDPVNPGNDIEARRPVAAAPLESTPQPPVATRVQAPGVERELEQLLSSLTACIDLLSSPGSELARGVGQLLLRAEVWRTTGLVKAGHVLRQDTPAARTSVPVSRPIDQLTAGFAAEGRLRGFDIVVTSALSAGAVLLTDERLLLIALSSAVRATLDLTGEGTGPVKMAVSANSANQVTFTISQHAVSDADTWVARAFDPDWVERPGGRAAALTLLALQQAATLLGGHAQTKTVARGTAITIVIAAGIHEPPAPSPRL